MMEYNCPFYGRAMTYLFNLDDIALIAAAKDDPQALRYRPEFAPFNLIATRSNQCALILDAHSPCALEIEGRPVEWSACERITGRLYVG